MGKKNKNIKLIVHQSTLKNWRRCHKLYYYKHVLGLEKAKTPSPFIRGTIVHAMIEAQAMGQDPWEVFDDYIEKNKKLLFQEEHGEYAEIEEMISDIMEGYFEYYKEDDLKPVSLTTVENGKEVTKYAEHDFLVPLVEEEGIWLGGTIDMIAEDPKNRIWLEDHKTHKKLPTGDKAYSNQQSALYAWGWEQMVKLGLWDLPNKPFGMVWNYIRWKSPTKPTLLKKGGFSKSKGQDTTWGVYLKAILREGLDPKDYQDMKELLTGKEDDFFVRHYLPINKNIQNNIVEDARTTAMDILKYGGEIQDRNLSYDCDRCPFYDLCQAQLKGLDDKLILQCEYQKAEKRHGGKQEETKKQRRSKRKG